MTSAATQQKFSTLRRRLDQLGYRQPLGIESLPLVERLFLDLVHTTESLKKVKLDLQRYPDEQGTGSVGIGQVDAYKSDNAKLIKENNELHQQLIHIKEDSEFTIKELKSSLRKIEHENADLKFLNNQYVHKMRALELESKQKTERILQLQEKNFHAVVQTPGGRKKSIPFRRQRMELDCTVPPAEPYTGSLRTSVDDPYMADLLKVADDNTAKLRTEVENLIEDKSGLQGKISNLQSQVDNRDAEISRMTRLLEGGRPYDVVALEARNRANERMISHLNIQIDFLQQKNQDLQTQLDKSLSKARSAIDLDARNYELTKELQDVDVMAAQLQREKDKIMHAADLEINQAKNEVNKLKAQLESKEDELEQIKEEKLQHMAELQGVKNDLKSDQTEQQRLNDLLKKLQDDKRKLGQRVTKLTTTERDLVLEIDRLRHHHHSKNGTTHKQCKTSAATEAFLKGLEEDRDYWKGEVETLQQLLSSKSRSTSPSARQRSRPVSPSPKSKTSRSTSPVNLSRSNSTQFDSIIRALEEERDRYKAECDLLKSTKSRSTSPARFGRETPVSDENELIRIRKERDELRRLLDKFERHMAEIQANVRILTQERDNMKLMYDEVKEELARVRRDAVRSPKSPKASLAAQAVLRRVENERDEAISNYRNVNVERDTFRERLKIATESQIADRAKFEQTIEDLENALHAAEMDKKALQDRLQMSQTFADTVDGRSKEHVSQLNEARDEAAQHRTTASQMRLIAEQAERSLRDQQSLLNRKEADLRAADNHIQLLEDQLEALKRSSQLDRDEISKLRSAIADLDHEKDDLQMAIDEKTEAEAKKTESISSKDRMITELRANLIEMETVLGNVRDSLSGKEREISSLRRQIDNVNDELANSGRGREVAVRENRRLQDDLMTMTRENQSLNQELDEALQEKERMKEQVQEYIMEVKRCEELLGSKEQERADILEQYRSLSQEAERYETQTHHLESEGSNLRLELLTRDSEIRRLRDKCEQTERLVQEHMSNEHSYEIQMSNLTKSVASLEEALRHMEDEKHNLLMDISAVRDLCARLETDKSGLQRQLMTKSLDQEKLQNLLDDMKRESDLLRSQVESERIATQNIEGVLQTNRSKEWQAQMAIQEKDAEVQLLKDRMALNDSKIESQSRELNHHRTRTIELESDLERLKRQLISERFERERAVQELRRNNLSLPGESRLGAISPISTRSRSPTRRSPLTSTAENLTDTCKSVKSIKFLCPKFPWIDNCRMMTYQA